MWLWNHYELSLSKVLKNVWIWPLFTFLGVFYIPEARCQPSVIRTLKLETSILHTGGDTHPVGPPSCCDFPRVTEDVPRVQVKGLGNSREHQLEPRCHGDARQAGTVLWSVPTEAGRTFSHLPFQGEAKHNVTLKCCTYRTYSKCSINCSLYCSGWFLLIFDPLLMKHSKLKKERKREKQTSRLWLWPSSVLSLETPGGTWSQSYRCYYDNPQE